MRRWILFVAGRFLGTRRTRGASATRLGVAGIAAGVATLIVVLAVMNGFQLGTIENILEINSFHLRIETGLPLARRDQLEQLGRDLAARPGVTAVVPGAELQTLARGFWPEPQGIVIRAVPFDWLERDPGAARRITMADGVFDLAQPGSIVLGAELARVLGVRVGDPLAITYVPDGSGRPAEQQLTVTGLFRSGYLDFDRGWSFVSLATAVDELASAEELVLGIKLDNRFRDESAARELAPLLPDGWRVESWREYNRGIFGALRVEKSMMVFLVALIFVVVAGNIYQVLRRSIIERSEEIAILRALGAGAADVRRVFALEGWIIGLAGTALGTVVGLLIVSNIDGIFALLDLLLRAVAGGQTGAFSPARFYIDRIPARILPRELLLIGMGSIGSAAGSSWMAGRRVTRRMPMELLR